MARIFCTISGFQPDVVNKLHAGAQRTLTIDSAWALGGILACGVSAAYLFWFCTASWVVAVTSTLIVLAILCALQGIVITGTGLDSSLPSEAQQRWRPSKARAVLFILFAVIFSQPLLIHVYQKFYAPDIPRLIAAGKVLHLELFKNSRKREEDGLLLQLATLREASGRQSTVDRTDTYIKPGDAATVIGVNSDDRRKAMLIGNQSYRSVQALDNAIKDSADMANALRKIGFSVTQQADGTRKDMEIALDRYIRSIKPGDISVLFYSGHGFQDRGNNYLVGIDAKLTDTKAVGVNNVIESISARQPLANVIVLDACRSFAQGGAGGLATTEAGLNTYIAFAAKPGQVAREPSRPGANGFFTAAILKHIWRPIDIDPIFRDVRAEVAQQTHNLQETWTAHSLKNSLVLASAESAKSAPPSSPTDATSNGVARPIGNQASCESLSKAVPSESRKRWIAECVEAKALKLRDDLMEHRQWTREEIARLEQQSRRSGHTAAELMTLFFSLWSHPFFSLAGTTLITLLLAGGFIRRDLRPEALLAYERVLQTDHNRFVGELKEDYVRRAGQFHYAPPVDVISMRAAPKQPDLAIDTTPRALDQLYAYWTKQPITAPA
ncbi:MAG: caspase family protein [Proteobacteria bacterium]|nr:caspase family protein [Pseudomonadota bacterium]